MNKKYYWFKLKENFFEDKKIKILLNLPEGYKMVVIYLKMQLKSLVTDGVITYENVMDSMFDEVALLIDEDKSLVEKTIKYLSKLGLIEVGENSIFMTALQENVGSETDVARRVRNSRLNKNNQQSLQCNTEKEKDLNLEKEQDTEKEKQNIYQQVADIFNDTCVSLPKVQRISAYRKKSINARLNSYTLDELKSAFEKAQQSDFLKGKNPKNWIANFDWIIKDCNLAKILDGNYDNPSNKTAQNVPKNEGKDFSDYSFTMDDINRILCG